MKRLLTRVGLPALGEGIDTTGSAVDRRRSLLPEVLLVVGLSLLAAWLLRAIAPPSLVRDGQRLPVGIASQHSMGGHHGSGGGSAAPSPVSDEAIPHFLGAAFLTAHLLAIALAVAVQLIRRLIRRFHWRQNNFVAQLLFAAVAAATTGGALVLAARFGYGDRLELREALAGAAEAVRYAFVVALVVIVIFGFRLRESTDRSGM